MRIGFDVAQTCVSKAGCGWVADLLAKALAENAQRTSCTYIIILAPGWIRILQAEQVLNGRIQENRSVA